MPVKKREPFMFNFKHNGEEYFFNTYKIFKKSRYICDCDLTATDYYGNELVTLICCKAALEAYYTGKVVGKDEYKQEVSETLKGLLGL
jgi:hypothetical protein